MRVEIDKEISDRVRNLRHSYDRLVVLRELICAETKLRLVCRILSERVVRIQMPPTVSVCMAIVSSGPTVPLLFVASFRHAIRDRFG